jgi:flagellar basal-body rod protein FlgF
MTEMRTVANNIANISTPGFRREGVVYSEWIQAAPPGGDSVSIAAARARTVDLSPGGMTATGAPFDFAIEGEGFFLVETPRGERLTRAGSFTPNEAGELVTAQGHRLLDAGGAPVFVPPEAGEIAVARDGTLSAAGRPLAQLGLVRPLDPEGLSREPGQLFAAQGGTEPVIEGRILQGHLEGSNVDPMLEMARMIEVQRAYELGQAFMERESKRRSAVLDTLMR